jgi:hypothetical protein
MEGYGRFLEPIYIEIALARGDVAAVERRLTAWRPLGFRDFKGLVTRLNALVALERRTEIEQEAPALVKPNTYLEPFALRALGFAREEPELIERAVARLETMGLDWHAAETRTLLIAA